MESSTYPAGPIPAAGAFTSDWAIPPKLPPDQVVAGIERDRMQMAKRPGMRQKHLPVRIDTQSGNFLTGGRYLFDTFEHAGQFKAWVENEFVLDGTKFFDRPYFLNPVCHVWRVIGAQDFADIRSEHKIIRSERWGLPTGGQGDLEQAWPQICAEAGRRGLSSAWLLHHQPEQLAGLITIAGRPSQGSPEQPDAAGLSHLESSSSLGARFDQAGWKKIFDRTSWVFAIWFPIAEGQPDVPALWPNSPPLPAPACAISSR